MSIQTRLESATANKKRLLFDNLIDRVGIDLKAIRFFTRVDKYGDEERTLINYNTIILKIEFPDEYPLYRWRLGNKQQVDEQGIYFYDVLPIVAYAKFEDDLELGDLIYFTINDDKQGVMKFLFQVTNILGKFSKELVWKSYYIAPYTGEIDNSIKKILEGV